MEYNEQLHLFLDIWKSENSIKTNKLMMLFAVQAILATAFAFSSELKWVPCVLGVLFSFFWFFCIGRTVAYQKHWKSRIDYVVSKIQKAKKDFVLWPSIEEERRMGVYGKVPSAYALLIPPVACFILWSVILTFVLTKMSG